jgi:hypothetical protein
MTFGTFEMVVGDDRPTSSLRQGCLPVGCAMGSVVLAHSREGVCESMSQHSEIVVGQKYVFAWPYGQDDTPYGRLTGQVVTVTSEHGHEYWNVQDCKGEEWLALANELTPVPDEPVTIMFTEPQEAEEPLIKVYPDVSPWGLP